MHTVGPECPGALDRVRGYASVPGPARSDEQHTRTVLAHPPRAARPARGAAREPRRQDLWVGGVGFARGCSLARASLLARSAAAAASRSRDSAAASRSRAAFSRSRACCSAASSRCLARASARSSACVASSCASASRSWEISWFVLRLAGVGFVRAFLGFDRSSPGAGRFARSACSRTAGAEAEGSGDSGHQRGQRDRPVTGSRAPAAAGSRSN